MMSVPPADCIFCKIVDRKVSASIVTENDVAVAFLDIRPINPGHTLVVPKEHAAGLADLKPHVGGKLFEQAQAVAAALRASGLPCEGVNFHLADGPAAGQEVFHVHLHVFPRFAGDGVGLRFGPRYGTMPPREELEQTASQIRKALPSSARRK
jgi:histidine triad (HIT) family protein